MDADTKEGADSWRWIWGAGCREDGFVNCRFGEHGPCLTPGHVTSEDVAASEQPVFFSGVYDPDDADADYL